MCSKKPLTDAERLLHDAFKGRLLGGGVLFRLPNGELVETDGYKAVCEYPEGPEDIEDPVDREREE